MHAYIYINSIIRKILSSLTYFSFICRIIVLRKYIQSCVNIDPPSSKHALVLEILITPF